jgi:hypothetical protein
MARGFRAKTRSTAGNNRCQPFNVHSSFSFFGKAADFFSAQPFRL